MAVTNVTPPTISGTARQGQTLQSSTGTWTYSLDYLTYAYQWERCDAAGANCVDIAGAVNSFYILTNADLGSTIRVEVTATEHSNPVGDLLPWEPPTAGAGGVAVVNWTMTNANRQSGTLLSGAGRDLVITSGETLTGPVAQINNWRNVIWIGGEINISDTGIDNYAIPVNATGTVHLEGLYVHGNGVSDAMMSRGGSSTCIWQIQNCRVQVHFKGGNMEHADCFQFQGGTKINHLRFARNTYITDYQGFMLRFPGPDSYCNDGDFRELNFRRLTGSDPSQAYIFIPDEDPVMGHPPNPPIGTITMDDVYIEHNTSSTQNLYPDKVFSDAFGPGGLYVNRYGIFQESDGGGTYYRPAQTTDVVPPGGSASGQSCFAPHWSGIIRVGVPPGGDFAVNGGTGPGMGYVSPGYA